MQLVNCCESSASWIYVNLIRAETQGLAVRVHPAQALQKDETPQGCTAVADLNPQKWTQCVMSVVQCLRSWWCLIADATAKRESR